MILQGLPPATQSLGIDLVTIEPAAITLCAPIVTPLRIIQRAPISTSSSIIIGALLAVRPSSPSSLTANFIIHIMSISI